MCEQPDALAAETLLPGVTFAEQLNTEPFGEQNRTVTGALRPEVSDWYYLPVDVPGGVREIEVAYSYDRPQVPPGGRGNALDIGIFSPAGVQLGNQRAFRGWSGGFRDRFTISFTLRFGGSDPAFTPKPAPASAPGRDRGRAWYRGDGHVHTVHSDGRRTRLSWPPPLGPPGSTSWC